MKFCLIFLCFLLTFYALLLRGQEPPLNPAPLMPLEPQFPLELTQANRQLFIDGPEVLEKERERIRQAIRQHTFPWLTLLTLLGLAGIGWTAYLMRDQWLKPEFFKKSPEISLKAKAEKALKELQAYVPLEEQVQRYYTDLSSVLLITLQHYTGKKMEEMTTQELAKKLETEVSLSGIQKNELLALLKEIDLVKFAALQPHPEKAQQMAKKIDGFLQSLATSEKVSYSRN